ncbi:MAG: GDP-mannose 4,6-dehydratase [Actinobacteria bacterium]|nr:GDP-mannose 4,6-dehydratase [Actinomycetota bacterium]
MDKNTILVTGGAGFIGSNLCERLITRGLNVTCLDNFNDFYDPSIKRRNIGWLLEQPNFELVEGDILYTNLLEVLFNTRSISKIIHLAARAGVRPSISQPLLYEKVNIRGTLNLLEMTKSYNVEQFIFGSSSSVYGNNRKVPFSEDDAVDNSISPYAATKRAGELLCHTYHKIYDINCITLRFFTVYGPRQRPEMAIHKFTRLIDSGKPIEIYGDGSSSRDYTYISDIIDGIESCLDKKLGFETINLGDSNPIKLIELVRLIEGALGKKADIKWMEHQQGDVDITYADITKAKNILNYYPKIKIEEGISEFVKWYVKQTDVSLT